MDYKKQIIEKVESFYVDVVEEFKETEGRIINDSKFKMLFKKKNYDGNIDHLKKCKKMALAIDVDDISIPVADSVAREVIKEFERCLVFFNSLCDAHTSMQTRLKKKADKTEELKFSEYKELFMRVQNCRNSLNGALRELDIVYSDFAYDEDDDSIEYVE